MSHVLNGTRFVEPETATRVRKAIEELEYSPNRLARGLRTGSSRTVAVLGISAVDSLFAEVVRGIEERCYERGYEVFLGYVEYPRFYSPDSLENLERWEAQFVTRLFEGFVRTPFPGDFKTEGRSKELDIIQKFLSREVNGLILNAGQPDDVLHSALGGIRQPVVLYQRRLEGSPFDSCVADDYGGTRAALERLLALGHRRIAMLYGFSWESHGARDRFRAWIDVHREAGLPLDPALLRQTLYEPPLAAQRALELLDLPQPPTAIFCWSDTLALAVLDACRHSGRSVPEDVSVVGFDDLDFASLTAPRLSSIHQVRLESGHRMADRLLDRVEGKADSNPVHLTIPTTFVERESVGPAKS